jgi:hypothetical protein
MVSQLSPNITEWVNRTAARPAQRKVLLVAVNCPRSMAKLSLATGETIPAIGDEAACPRQALTAIAEGDGLDTAPDESAVMRHGLAAASKHVKCACQTPENQRTVRRKLVCLLPDGECPLVIKLLVVSERQTRKQPVGIRLTTKRRTNQSACSLPVASSNCVFDFTGHMRMPPKISSRMAALQ